jgi:two-component system chemotaxis response regulator CheB
MQEIRVLAVDDSILFRRLLSQGMTQFPDIKVVSVAVDPFDATDKIISLRPDVVTLDVEMPGMDGVKFLRALIPQYPVPVVVISSLHESVFDAMDAGAVDFVAKPADTSEILDGFLVEVATKIRVAAAAKLSAPGPNSSHAPAPDRIALKHAELSVPAPANKVIAMGASTGGTEAIYSILTKYGANMPGFVIAQHMPEGFTDMFAARLNSYTRLQVKEAADGDEVTPGKVLIAPGGRHMTLRRIETKGHGSRAPHAQAARVPKAHTHTHTHAGQKGFSRVPPPQGAYPDASQQAFIVRVDDKRAKVNGHRPSVDVLFESVAEAAGPGAIGVLLTGMGADGALGLKLIREAGGYTIAQDEKSSVVYGMPMAAATIDAVTAQLPLYRIPDEILKVLDGT